MPLKRPHGVSDVTGESGLASMRALRARERAPVKWARRRHARCPHDEATSAKALHGQGREEHLWALAPAVALDDRYHAKIAACDRQIAAHLATFAERQDHDAGLPKVRPRPRTRHRPRFEVRGKRHRVTGGDLSAMAGMDEPTALTRIRALGLDMGRGPTVQHFRSWLGLCPHHRVSGGQG